MPYVPRGVSRPTSEGSRHGSCGGPRCRRPGVPATTVGCTSVAPHACGHRGLRPCRLGARPHHRGQGPLRGRGRQGSGGVPAPARGLRRPAGGRSRVRPRPARAGRHSRCGRHRGRDQRRQLEHPHGPGGARDLRRGARRGPHLRPAPGGHLRAPGHHHHRHRAVDHRPGAPQAGARRRRRRLGRPQRQGGDDRASGGAELGGAPAQRDRHPRRGPHGRGQPHGSRTDRHTRPGHPGRRRGLPGGRGRPRRRDRPPPGRGAEVHR